jgi:hypothetical protein
MAIFPPKIMAMFGTASTRLFHWLRFIQNHSCSIEFDCRSSSKLILNDNLEENWAQAPGGFLQPVQSSAAITTMSPNFTQNLVGCKVAHFWFVIFSFPTIIPFPIQL